MKNVWGGKLNPTILFLLSSILLILCNHAMAQVLRYETSKRQFDYFIKESGAVDITHSDFNVCGPCETTTSSSPSSSSSSASSEGPSEQATSPDQGDSTHPVPLANECECGRCVRNICMSEYTATAYEKYLAQELKTKQFVQEHPKQYSLSEVCGPCSVEPLDRLCPCGLCVKGVCVSTRLAKGLTMV
jgi:hypothetical protein